ncbi:D-ala D-ala ligase N-terminus [Musa troglodytarum]|uniref:D-ala D-ala ligase N-terminus n=1 Tax=Musa troglodytarum TaxID=320322 RepID=A0A9E7I2K9_9LILI|nr:D-ala D-ala ligase N-terminus [Musa troglodytarum]
MKKLDLVARAVTMCRGAVSDGDARMLLWTVPTRYPIKESPGEVEVSTPSIRSFPHRPRQS